MPLQHRHIIDVMLDGVRDIARPNMFEVEFHTGPNHSQVVEASNLEISQHLVRSLNIPQTNMGDIIIRRMGRRIIMPGSIDFTDLIISFHNDIRGITRKFLLDWQKNYLSDISGGEFKSVKDFIGGKVTVYQLDGFHERISKTVCRNAYPKVVGDIDLNHETDDALIAFNGIFTFSFMETSNSGPSFSDLV